MKPLLLALLLTPALACAEDLRVLTFNIRFDNPKDGPDAWPHRKEAVAKLIGETADVAGLQEVKPNQREWLKEHLPAFGIIGVGREPGDQGEAVPVVYRKDRFTLLASGTFWLSDQPDQPGSASFGNRLPRICTWAKLRDAKAANEKEATVWFYNVHLDHESAPAREQGILLTLDRVAKQEDGGPAILVGDFNSAITDGPCRAIAAREKPRLVSSYEALGKPAEGTFHSFSTKVGKSAIDFIYSDQERWTVKESTVLKTTYPGIDGQPRFVSDHFPVQAVLTRR